jgi:glycine cleavage system pyridoxal-binding protein P
VIAKLHEAKAIAVVAADPLALMLLKPPGEMGADVAVGSTAYRNHGLWRPARRLYCGQGSL